jgi:predicted RNA-binding protein with EMAP domain
MSDKKKSYKERNGTTAVGNLLRKMAKAGKSISKPILEVASTITGIESLKDLGDLIMDSKELSEADKQMLLEELKQDTIEMQEVTKRWSADMMSDSWLSKNIRPLSLAFLTITLFVYIILDSSLEGFTIADNWIELLSSLLLLVYGGYFGFRSAEKITKEWRKNS